LPDKTLETVEIEKPVRSDMESNVSFFMIVQSFKKQFKDFYENDKKLFKYFSEKYQLLKPLCRRRLDMFDMTSVNIYSVP